MNKPLLEIFVTTWNEEKILPDFIKWYRSRVPDCLITVIDNQSTDLTTKIAFENECKIISFTSNNEMDEQTLMNIRNNCWKDSEAEWCLVVDCDELVDIDTHFLKTNNTGMIFKCVGYEMFGTEEDTIETLIQGCPSAGYCKPVLFRNHYFEEINLKPGSHDAEPLINKGITDVLKTFSIVWDSTSVNLYHTKWRSWTNGIERARLLAKRRSEHSKQMGWNFHYELDESIHKDYYDNGIKNRVNVR